MPTALAPSVVTDRDPKGVKFLSVVVAAYNKAKLSEEEAQRVNETPGLGDLIADFIAKNRNPNKYRDEEVASHYGYLSGYRKPKSIKEQVRILSKIFPGIGNVMEKLAEQPVPANAEGWFAIPKWQTIAPTYSEAVQKVLGLIKQTRNGKFYNYRDGQINEERLRQSVKSAEVFQKLGEEQKGHDTLVVACQFGIRHRGRSVRRSLEVMDSQEFGLGAFAVGIMLLTHPERLQHYDDLWIDCSGDEFDDPDADVRFGCVPYFNFIDGDVGFDARSCGLASGGFGSASGFLPQ